LLTFLLRIVFRFLHLQNSRPRSQKRVVVIFVFIVVCYENSSVAVHKV